MKLMMMMKKADLIQVTRARADETDDDDDETVESQSHSRYSIHECF